ncbi:MAG TPA: hypothetical protein VGN51_12530 [Acidimicrobiia bacterium]|jgi:hypothetical protein
MTRRRAALYLTALVFAIVGVTATPAAAHGLGGLSPTNYESVLRSVTPTVPGLHVRVTDLGTKVELTNRGATEVVVSGYAGEPYLRVGPKGVFENTRSPATYLNRSSTITGSPPKSADAKATPVWRRVSTGNTASWHDHRAHFMGGDDPPEVVRHPDQRRVVDNWVIPMRVGTENVTARGQLIYVPPPSPWPWVVGAVLIGALVVVLSRTRAWRTVFAVALALLTVTEIGHVIGLWDASTASFGTKLGESAYSLAGIALGLLGLGWIWRKGAESAVPIVLVATIFLFVAGGLADVTSLGNSQVPSTFSAGFARMLVTLTLGLGAGLAVAAALRLRPAPPARPAARRRRPAATVTS